MSLSDDNWFPNKGNRIELVHTNDEHTKLSLGDKGEIIFVDIEEADYGTYYIERIDVKWDSGSNLSLVPGEGDQFIYYPKEEGKDA